MRVSFNRLTNFEVSFKKCVPKTKTKSTYFARNRLLLFWFCELGLGNAHEESFSNDQLARIARHFVRLIRYRVTLSVTPASNQAVDT